MLIRRLLAKTRLRLLLLALLATFGILPIVFTTIANLRINRDLVEREEQLNLSRQVEQLAERWRLELDAVTRQLELLRAGWLATGADRDARSRLLRRFVAVTEGNFHVRAIDPSSGLVFQPDLEVELERVAEAARAESRRFALAPRADGKLWLVVTDAASPGEPVFQALLPFDVTLAHEQELFVLDRVSGQVLWADPAPQGPVWDAVSRSPEVRGYLEHAVSVFEYGLRLGASTRPMLGRIVPLGDTPWALLLQRPKSAALVVFRRLVANAILIGAVTVLLALLLGAFASNVVSRPIQELAETSHEIASGHFGKRVPVRAASGLEITELAESFNTMSEHVESHVRRLRRAAQVNRELFISTLRVMLAAIEAKEPYTAGHSERVAAYSRAMARRLMRDDPTLEGLKEEAWTAGLLHDIGKIGIEDRILNKGDILTHEEFEEMKRHPVLGADILAPVDALRPILPAIRYHHERWLGGGYPEGLVGKEIPLLARIVAVADTFDALTTQRVYQDPYSPEEALQILRDLSGKGFDPRIAEAFFGAFESGEIEAVAVRSRTGEPRSFDALTAIHT
ncbi:MAG TPA: HD domain-containing phosphohydrolase [Thermoanaerobaculia bacterium]|nr:HD domain-containing phosphohydrolase [Thermoanaerobaculia bacterium]